MGRFRPDMLERVESFSDRIIDVVEALEVQKRPRRVIDQLAGCGTSVGANTWEADEAVSRADFAKTIGIVLKELNESRFWLRMAARRSWIPNQRLTPLQAEAEELKKIFGAILSRTRKNVPKKSAA